ncbi:MAG: aminotransferase class V-fold PLP-dependent enzyme [Caldilineaceae bacterium]|nr:aminotransferase class V-fold PLP-dependent enzyme [Caldilineaceae bacterium]MDE0337468.1 aminotransferase class V-fold PLP-dependent enzyme [Caldilineaceae bacterium]
MDSEHGEPENLSLSQLRADVPLTSKYIYLNSCTFGPVLRSVQRCMADALREENEEIIAARGKEAGVRFYERAEKARQSVAELLGVPVSDVAWVYNTTTASRLAIMSVDWKAGDKLAVTDVEHLSTHQAARGLAQGRGVEVTVVPTAEPGESSYRGPDYFLEQLDQTLKPSHRLLVMSHVSNIDGRWLPVVEGTRLARSRGVETLVDGAQSVGMFGVDAYEIGAEFFSGSTHKWLMGPPGIGFLVVSDEGRKDYNPFCLPLPMGAGGGIDGSLMAAGALNELGTQNYALRIGAGACVETVQGIGLEKIEEQCRSLTERLRGGLHCVPGIRVASPGIWEHSSSVTTIQLHDGTPQRCLQLIERLLDEYRIVVKYRPEICGVRIGVAAFNTGEEIEQLLAALDHLAPQV